MKTNRQQFLAPTIVLLLVLLVFKAIYISFGLPYTTHADETTILRDPLKLLLSYSHGDFSMSTNLYNWVILGWLFLVFITGLIFGRWSNLDGFQEYLIAEPSYSLLDGRILSLCFGVIAAWFLIRLICKITTDYRWRWLLSVMVLFNPIEVNAVNWIKFDAPAYLAYVLLIYWGYGYFIEQRGVSKTFFYVISFIAASVRIEVVAYLMGFLMYDFFIFSSHQPFRSRFVGFIKPIAIGIAVYSIITLLPLTFIYKLLHQDATSYLATTPTFEDAILSKMPGFSYLGQALLYSDYYIKCLLVLMGPMLLYFFFRHMAKLRVSFLLFPFIITVLVLLVFPIKSVHYLLNVSLLICVGSAIFLAQSPSRVNFFFTVLSVAWTFSFCLSQAYVFQTVKDVRLEVRDYLFSHTQPSDLIYVEGSFSQIYDKRDRYRLKVDAAHAIGSTGLSNEYLANHLDDRFTRRILEVTDWEYFANTPYVNTFGNNYDTARLLQDMPLYYVLVTHISEDRQFVRKDKFKAFLPFYNIVKQNYHIEREFSYPQFDPRLRYVNYYYLNEVVLYRRNKNNAPD